MDLQDEAAPRAGLEAARVDVHEVIGAAVLGVRKRSSRVAPLGQQHRHIRL